MAGNDCTPAPESQKAVVAALMTSLVKKVHKPIPGCTFTQGGNAKWLLREKFRYNPRHAIYQANICAAGDAKWKRVANPLDRAKPCLYARLQRRYPGNQRVKQAFLNVLHDIEEGRGKPNLILSSCLRFLPFIQALGVLRLLAWRKAEG